MAKLTAKARNALPSKDFVFPKTRKFPIEDPAHAADAKSRAAAKGGAVQSAVDAAVSRKYPGMGSGKPRGTRNGPAHLTLHTSKHG